MKVSGEKQWSLLNCVKKRERFEVAYTSSNPVEYPVSIDVNQVIIAAHSITARGCGSERDIGHVFFLQ